MREILLILASVAAMAGPARAADDPTGEWLVEDGSGKVRIDNCGGEMWGVVSWENKPYRDTNNPDPALRSRPTLGMPILLGLKPVVKKRWEGNVEAWQGHVYNAKNGKTYDVSIWLNNPNTLHIEGCVLGGIFCGGQDWTRVAPPPSQPAARSNPKSAQATSPVGDVCSRVSSSLSGRAH